MLPNINNPNEGSARLKHPSNRSLKSSQITEIESPVLNARPRLINTRPGPSKETTKIINKKINESASGYSTHNKKSTVLPHSKYLLMQKELRTTFKESPENKKSSPFKASDTKHTKIILNALESHTNNL